MSAKRRSVSCSVGDTSPHFNAVLRKARPSPTRAASYLSEDSLLSNDQTKWAHRASRSLASCIPRRWHHPAQLMSLNSSRVEKLPGEETRPGRRPSTAPQKRRRELSRPKILLSSLPRSRTGNFSSTAVDDETARLGPVPCRKR